ncbi:MAG: phosphoglycerate kinase [Candidatus Nitrospinota bacterium M3_3B_026]
MNKMSIRDIDLAGKRVFIRVDFNVPVENGEVVDDTRIKESIPTIRHAAEAGAKVILASHMGRPKGKPSPELSLEQVAPSVSEHLGKPVAFAGDCVGEEVENAVADMKDGDVLLLENLRFYPEEEENDEEFSEKLARLADLYVNDAFGTAHRAHASTEGITRFVNPAVAGFLMEKEIEAFNKALKNPERPLAAVFGGVKVSTKLAALDHLTDRLDIIIIGGAMAFTFLRALGFGTGKNIVEEEMLGDVREIMVKARKRGVKLYLPVDFVAADSLEEDAGTDLVTRQDLPENMYAPDIGPATIALFRLALKPARTIIWNGPMGVFEKPPFAAGTMAVAQAMADSGALTVVGGGDSGAAVNMAGLAGRMSYISTGGGAFLELMEGRTLPGIAALTDAD